MTNDKEFVTDYMSTKLITFQPNMDIQEATQTLLYSKISGAPVVNERGDLVGMLSEKDCINLLLDGQYNQRPTGTGKVSDYMSKKIKTLAHDTSIMDAAYQFANSPYRRFPIINSGKLVGQISRRDVLKAIVKRRPNITLIPSSWKPRVPAF